MASPSDSKLISKLALVVAVLALVADIVTLLAADESKLMERAVTVAGFLFGDRGAAIAADLPFIERYSELWPVYFVFIVLLNAAVYFELTEDRIPDEVTIPGMVIGIGLTSGLNYVGLIDSTLGLLAGVLFPWTLKRFFENIYQREALGMGVITMCGMIGAFFGVGTVIIVLAIASYAAITYSIAVRLVMDTSNLVKADGVEFGPFIAIAAIAIAPFGPFHLPLR